MKLITYQSDRGPRAAGLRDDGAVDLNRTDSSLPSCIKRLLAGGPELIADAARATTAGAAVPLDQLELTPPIPSPEKIICVGLNYADHAREGGVEPPDEPVIFNKLSTAAWAHERPVVLPRNSQQVDYEAELVAVIGRGGRHIPIERALEHVAAYCCGNDVSARDWQLGKPGGQWLLGKTFDTFAPFGPYLVTADDVPDPHKLAVQLRLNGQVMQDSNTDQFIFPIDRLVSHVSDFCTLSPGDLLFTGTPPGVGFAKDPPVFVQPGDVMEVEIERLGTLRNSTVAE